jgi:hypothetical protein
MPAVPRRPTNCLLVCAEASTYASNLPLEQSLHDAPRLVGPADSSALTLLPDAEPSMRLIEVAYHGFVGTLSVKVALPAVYTPKLRV